METQINSEEKGNRKIYWLVTFVSLAACITLLLFMPVFFWITLPFLFTYFVKAIGMI